MNPEDNNPFNNSGTDPLGGAGSMPGVGGLSMNDSLASAQDNLTSAGLAANDNSGVMGLDQIGASAPEAVMAPPVNEPLVPAAPVPGSIGSAISVPPLEPQPVAAEPAQPYNPFAANPTVAAAPATNPAPAPTQNPFAQPTDQTSNPQPSDQLTQGSQPVNPFAAPQPTPAGMAAAQPMPNTTHDNDIKSSFKNPITIIAIIAAIVFLILTIVFVVLWRGAVDNTRIVYVPTTSEDGDTAAKPQDIALICTRAVPAESIAESGDFNIVSGENTLEVIYHGDEIQGVNTATNLVYNEVEQAEAARADAENNWPALKELIGANDDILTVTYTTDGNVFRTEFNITANDPTWVSNVLGDLGVPAEDAEHTLTHVRATAEANGYSCVEE